MCKSVLSIRVIIVLSVALLVAGCQAIAGVRSVSSGKLAEKLAADSLVSSQQDSPVEASDAEESALVILPQVEGGLPQVVEGNVDSLINLVNNEGSLVQNEELPGQIELTLLTAIHMAMENSDTLRVISGATGTVAAATAYDQAIENSGIQEEYGAFDPLFNWTTGWERIDQPSGRTTDAAFIARNQLDRADLEASLTKRLYSGGVAAIEYDTRYTFFPGANPGSFLNPQYFTPLTFRFAQPLLQGAGRKVNLAPLEIARIEAKQSTWDFKQAALDSVRDIESAYWQVYSSEVEVKVLSEVLPMFEEIVRINRERADVEAAAPVDADQAASNFWRAKRSLIEAQLRRADSRNLLRNLLGMPPSDRRELVLAAEPNDKDIRVDSEEAFELALQERPDIVRQRLTVRIRFLEKVIAENQKKIRLDGVAAWRINGLGSDLGDALEVLGDNNFTDWELGFQVSVPLGRNSARARLRAANLSYRREMALLEQTTHAANHDIAESIRSIYSLHEQIDSAKQELFFAEKWQTASRERYLNPALTGSKLADLNNYLQALRIWSQAKSIYASRVGQYNTALASLEVATGTLLDSRMVNLSFNSCRAATNLFATERVNFYSDDVQEATPAEAADLNEETLTAPDAQ